MAISKIIADSITDEAVTSAKIATGTVIAADIADGTVTNAKIDTVANTKITGVITNAQLANTTGSGAVVLTTSPTLVTPALGTPSALVGTNISGTGASFTAGSVTNNANLTGHVTSVGNAAVLGSFTSAQLAAALSNETGSGLAVFGTSPTLATPTFDSAQLATVVGTAPLYMCRAWVNFNGTGTVAIRASGNVSSITDNGTGDYTVNFTTAMSDANYATQMSYSSEANGTHTIGFLGPPAASPAASYLAGSCRVSFYSTTASGNTADKEFATLSFFR